MKPNRVRLVISTGNVYEVELTAALKSNLEQLGNGFVPRTDWLQVHDEEWVNLKHMVSFQFYEEPGQIIESSTGHVIDATTKNDGWQPGKTGSGVYTVEPQAVSDARRNGGLMEPDDTGGDME